ncbi:MAG TPA: type II toxin-antitoxin system RelE/ParE family toxin [Thermoanaerobaculia bacterium]|nr:type II toxin-antitoxin system RelE/ParE family toxin [Thermoanaerobaculia bacterium]
MKLVRIAQDHWDVLAVMDHRGDCQVLDFLEALAPNYHAAKKSMFVLLRSVLPKSGPPKHNEISKSLGGGIFELRRQPKGRKLRVVYFYDSGFRIICTSAFTKAETTPQIEIESARFLARRYREARFRNELVIVGGKA